MRKAARAADPNNPLSVAQLELLSVLLENPGRPGQLAQRLHLRPNTITTLVNSLTREGMLTRRQDKQDRRAVELVITGAGRQAVRRWQAVNNDILTGALDQLPAPVRRQLTAVVPAIESLSAIIDARTDRQ